MDTLNDLAAVLEHLRMNPPQRSYRTRKVATEPETDPFAEFEEFDRQRGVSK